ncbi:MAG: 4Fe-4S cluster-binding domain-containing protein [Eubacterium sp.]|jgi:hypothetical protein|nr:4Fe-4S cluster-binding domain-containing protein [Eubacterium sp.]
MKWKNKGHELDQTAEEISELVRLNDKIYVFGAGVYGKNTQEILEYLHMFGGYIDNDEEKQKNGVDGREVISFDQFIKSGRKNQIVIAADKKNIPIISRQLSESGLELHKNYFAYEEFMYRFLPIIMAYVYDTSFVALAQICLTERCSLKCEKCAHGCFNVGNDASDMETAVAFQSADSFFAKVDVCGEFVLIGGEPLLYRDLPEVIAYVGEKYRGQMMIFSITTNGTILPGPSVIEMCQKYDVTFRISNYSKEIPALKEKYEKLTALLDENHISYTLGKPEEEWIDYGFDSVVRDADEEKLTEVFDACKTPCREIRGDKFYYCVMARSVSDNLKFHEGEDDYLDMSALTGEDYKKILLEFGVGYSDKGYLDMCRRCNGAEAYRYPVPAARQRR